MKFHEMIDHKLRQYNYKRKRNNPSYRADDFEMEEFLNEVDSFAGEMIQRIDRFLPKRR